MTAATPPVSALLAGVAMAVLASCARQEAPPGGPEDLRPPVVVRTEPETFATVEELDEVRFEFDERISERVGGGGLNSAISVSPRGGDVQVSHGRRSLTVQMEGGFQPGLVYRITLNPVVSDLFGNQLRDPFELILSTGGEPVPNTLAGEVWDRIDGSAMSNAVVYATASDGLVHQGSTDRDGIFALRYLPAGSFNLIAFEDTNRDGEIDSTEVQGGSSATLSVGDTVLVDIPILAPDTAAAILVEAEALDSVTVVLEFDDYLEPSLSALEVDVQIRTEEGTTPGIIGRYQEAEYATFVEEVADSFLRLDSLDAEEARRTAAAAAAAAAAEQTATEPADSTAIAPDAVPAPPDTALIESLGTGGGAPTRQGPPRRVPPSPLTPLQGSAPGPTADGRRVLPGKRIVVLLDAPLTYDLTYEIDVTGVTNINGLTDGGGTVEFVRVTPPPDTTAIDTLALGDSMLVVDDSASAGDSAAVPDTGVVSPARRSPGGSR